jgi:hypothetical protein
LGLLRGGGGVTVVVLQAAQHPSPHGPCLENVLSDIEDADVYIDDAGAFSSNWDHHVNLLATILR